jgi:hypothetical protein
MRSSVSSVTSTPASWRLVRGGNHVLETSTLGRRCRSQSGTTLRAARRVARLRTAPSTGTAQARRRPSGQRILSFVTSFSAAHQGRNRTVNPQISNSAGGSAVLAQVTDFRGLRHLNRVLVNAHQGATDKNTLDLRRCVTVAESGSGLRDSNGPA